MRLLDITLTASSGQVILPNGIQPGEAKGIITRLRYSIESPVDGEILTAQGIGQIIAAQLLKVEAPYTWQHQEVSGMVSFDLQYKGVTLGHITVQPGTSIVQQPIIEIYDATLHRGTSVSIAEYGDTDHIPTEESELHDHFVDLQHIIKADIDLLHGLGEWHTLREQQSPGTAIPRVLPTRREIPPHPLKERRQKVLELTLAGKSEREIAQILAKSPAIDAIERELKIVKNDRRWLRAKNHLPPKSKLV